MVYHQFDTRFSPSQAVSWGDQAFLSLIREKKRHHVVFGGEIQTQNLNVFNIIEVIIQSQKYLLFSLLNKKSISQREIRSPEHCLRLERWQGPPHINKVRHMKL